jgi:ABC-2 type transport system permease protein
MIFVVLLPLAYPVVYSLIYNPEVVKDVKVVAIDDDRSSLSRELIRNIDASPEVDIIGYAPNMDEGKNMMNMHRCYGLLYVPEGFQSSQQRGEQAYAILYSDMSLLLRYRAMLVAATNVAQQMSAEITSMRLAADGSETIILGDIQDVFEMKSVAMGDTTEGFDSFVMPGVLILIFQQCIILVIGMRGGAKNEMSLYKTHDKKRGGKHVTEKLIGQIACYATLFVPIMIYLTYYVPLMFSFPMIGDEFEILLFLVPMMLASIFMGLILQRFVSEREAVFMIWVVTSIVFLFLSGLTWPRYAMSDLWLALGSFVPATWGIEGFVFMNSCGADLSQVGKPYFMLWLLSLLYACGAIAVMRLRRN